MTFLAPWALAVAGAIASIVTALHFLASASPRVTLLPTARFVPEHAARATSRAYRFSDLALLALRVAIVMLVGLAFARPALTRTRRPVGRVVMVDRSRSVRSSVEAADSAARLMSRGDVVIAFDSTARRLGGKQADSLRAIGESGAAGSISAALAAGMRTASALRGDADSVELVLVSPFAADEWDAATAAIRAAWPGRVRLVRVTSADAGGGPRARVEMARAALGDPVRAAAALLGAAAASTGGAVRIDRGAPASADTTWAGSAGHVLVRWPKALDASGWRTRARADTAGAIAAGAIAAGAGNLRSVVVSPFARTVDPPAGRVIARWADGAPAATERTLGSGCVRDVAIAFPAAGDLALRESVRRLVATLAAPCGGVASTAPLADSALATLRGAGALVASRALAIRSVTSGGLETWLLVAALVLLLAEPLLRRQRVQA